MNAREIKKLRNKFILAAMLSIFVAMFFVGLTVNLITHAITRNAVNRTLDALIESAEKEENYDYSYNGDTSGRGPSLSDIFLPLYSNNHYFVFSTSTGELSLMFTNTASSDELGFMFEFAKDLLGGSKTRGQHGSYYFRIKTEEDNAKIIAILEGSVIISTELRTLYATIAIFLLGLLITYLLVRHFSAAAIRPEIENSMRQKQFITNASHELKTPLAVIRANTEMVELLNGESEWTTSTLKQVDHLSGLIQNLVMITRSQEKEDRGEMTETDAARAVNESIDPYELMAAQSGKKIVRDIESGCIIRADESKIRQLTTILIDNALKYCDENGTIGVSLRKTRNGKGLNLTVSNDYAEGSSVDCSRFFDRFYREDASHNIDKGGYGIGLSIAESICRQYDGDIHAEWKNGTIHFICTLKSQK